MHACPRLGKFRGLFSVECCNDHAANLIANILMKGDIIWYIPRQEILFTAPKAQTSQRPGRIHAIKSQL